MALAQLWPPAGEEGVPAFPAVVAWQKGSGRLTSVPWRVIFRGQGLHARERSGPTYARSPALEEKTVPGPVPQGDGRERCLDGT